MAEEISAPITKEHGLAAMADGHRSAHGRRIASIVTALGCIIAIAVAAFVLWLWEAEREALPVMDGTLRVSGLSAPATVRRDEHGVPHIVAATQDDLFFAQGFVTAQDRLWQMDMFRRNANGTLAEVLGQPLLKHDRMQRILEIRRTAQRIYTNLPSDDRKRLDDYARGVNAYIAQAEAAGHLPAEFKLLMYKPQPWTGADCVSVGLMEVQELDMHAATKLDRWYIRAKLNNPQLEADLYPVGSWRDHPPTGVDLDLSVPHSEPSIEEQDDENDDSAEGPSAPAQVVVSQVLKDGGRYNRRGESSVAPTPNVARARLSEKRHTKARSRPAHSHVPESRPGTLHGQDEQKHASRLRSAVLRPAEDDVSGLARVGLDPAGMRELGRALCDGCTEGSNEWVVAGSHTASGKPLLSNDMHIRLTEPNIWYMAALRAPGFDAAGVTLPGVPFIIAGHNEHVAWGFTDLMADVQDLYWEKLDGKGDYEGIDGEWHPLQVDRETIHVRFGRSVTTDVESTDHGPLVNSIVHEPRPLALKWNLYDPSLHTIPLYALDTASSWAEFSAALENWCWPAQNLVYSDDQGNIAYHAIGKLPLRPAGLMGVPIVDNTHEWQGYIPFDDMPEAYDPPSGFLATANSRVTTDKSPYPLTLEWIDPYRIERIYKMLDGHNGLTPKDMVAVQTDIYSELDQEMGQRFAYAIDNTPGADERLREAANLLRVWDGRLMIDSAAASVVAQARAALWPLILKPKLGALWREYHWGEKQFAEEEIVMDQKMAWLPPGYKDWNALLTEAVREGMKRGNAPSDVRNWHYGDWHVIEIEHPLAEFLPLIGRFAGTGPQPASGDTTTVKQISPFVGPSQRFTMNWSNMDGSTENIVLGESSDPLSPYYRDQWEAWYEGTTFPLPFTPAMVARHTTHTLMLEP